MLNQKWGLFAGLLLLIVVSLSLWPVAQAQDTVSATQADIDVTETGFEPLELTVTEGTTVRWVNRTAITYTVLIERRYTVYLPLILSSGGTSTSQRAPVEPRQANGQLLPPNGAVSEGFAEAGLYEYQLLDTDFAVGLLRVIVPDPDATATPTVTATVSTTPTVTMTVTPTSTVTPTLTPTVSPTLTLTPTATPTDDGYSRDLQSFYQEQGVELSAANPTPVLPFSLIWLFPLAVVGLLAVVQAWLFSQ